MTNDYNGNYNGNYNDKNVMMMRRWCVIGARWTRNSA